MLDVELHAAEEKLQAAEEKLQEKATLLAGEFAWKCWRLDCIEDVQNPVQQQLRCLRGPLSPFVSLGFSAVVRFRAGPSPPWSEPMLP